MVLGIVWLWWIGSILAVIFGRVAMKQIDNSEGTQTGRGMAIAGLVLGLVGIGFLLFVVAVTVLGNDASDKFDSVGTSINTG